MHPILALAAFAVNLSVPLAAQAPPRIIGLTRNLPLVISQDGGTCVLSQCAPLGFPATSGQFAGGTAWDATTRGVWISQGVRIAKVDPRNQCIYQCPIATMPNTVNNLVTGLAYNEITNTLFVTDLSGLIRWYSVGGGCQLSLISRCVAPIPAGWTLTGCATDDLNGFIFYCAVVPGTPGGIVWVASQTAPCMPFCKFPVDRCGNNSLGLLTGLAYDACKRTLWATDGKRTVGGVYGGANCAFNAIQCCPNTSGDPLVGLGLVPSTETSHGQSCTDSTCPACAALRHVLGSDPTVGNAAFSLDLVNAPANSNSYMLLNLGPCIPPGIFSPPFCAGIAVPFAPPPMIAGPIFTGGGVGCTGASSVALPIPNNPALCGVVFSSQYVGLCSTPGAFGTFVSNCLSWSVWSP